ncbi:MAG: hypothetical protein H6R14_2802 [Proteobacteria bacterium]|nr:hypothetical protein [Pseudomonadota bacterium]
MKITQFARRSISLAVALAVVGGSASAENLLFTSNRGGGHNQIYVLDTITGKQTQITGGVGGNSNASISPDGKQIAFVSTRDNWPRVYVMNNDGSEVKRLVTADGYMELSPSWSPDGKSVAFYSQSTTSQGSVLKVVDVDTGKSLEIKGNGLDKGPTAPSWSADGRRIAFQGTGSAEKAKSEVFVVNRDGSDLREISTGAGNRAKGFPQVSPDGRKVVFVADLRNQFDLFVSDLDNDAKPINISQGAGLTHEAPRWSPDGKQLVFVSTRSGSDKARIFVANADGSNARSLTDGQFEAFDPHWAANGREVVFVTLLDGRSQLYAVSVDGGSPHPLLSSDKGFDTEPVPFPAIAKMY